MYLMIEIEFRVAFKVSLEHSSAQNCLFKFNMKYFCRNLVLKKR